MIRPRKPKDPKPPELPAVLDIETDRQGQIRLIGIMLSDGRRFVCASFDDMADWLAIRVKRGTLRLWAHNGGKFDWLYLLFWASKRKLPVRVGITRDRIVNGSLSLGKLTLRLSDSFALMPYSLAELARVFGVSAFYKRVDPRSLPYGDLLCYLLKDLQTTQQVLYRFFQLLFEEFRIGRDMPGTVGGLAMKIWKGLLEEPISTTWDGRTLSLEKASYKGGRTQAFVTGLVDRVYVYDVNSMYPAQMKLRAFPVWHTRVWDSTYKFGKLGVWEVRFRQTNRSVEPVLLDFETGEYRYEGWGCFCSPELDLFLEVGGELEVIRGFTYVNAGNPFVQFVERLYELKARARETGDEALAFACKMVMNALYGKFAQDSAFVLTEVDAKRCEAALAEGRKYYIHQNDELMFAIEEVSIRREYYWPVLSSMITSYARSHLYQLIQEAKARGANVLYVDTDSIHVDKPVFEDSRELGALKLEKTYRQVYYVGKKAYIAYDTQPRLVYAGIPIKTLTERQWRTIISGKAEILVFTVGTTVFGLLEAGELEFDKPRRVVLCGKGNSQGDGEPPGEYREIRGYIALSTTELR